MVSIQRINLCFQKHYNIQVFKKKKGKTLVLFAHFFGVSNTENNKLYKLQITDKNTLQTQFKGLQTEKNIHGNLIM